MSITHIGKIGRLPKCTRDELGHRIEDGEPGKELVKWLNGEPGVQEILKEQFGGRLITEQNLSEWKQTGHPEWLRHEKTRVLVSNLTEQHDNLEEAADGMEISDRIAGVLAVELSHVWRSPYWKKRPTRKNNGSAFAKYTGNCPNCGVMITGPCER